MHTNGYFDRHRQQSADFAMDVVLVTALYIVLERVNRRLARWRRSSSP